MATASFGQSFQITPIQMITAYSAIANGGNLLKPHLIKELTDSEDNIIQKFDPEIVRNVISKQTTNTLKGILEGVVSEGTGINAYVEGYKVAGKTATSETFENGIRSKEHYIASFSAFAPADNPVICVLVVLDYPSKYDYHGGVVAGPVAASIIDDSLNYLGIEKKYTEKDKQLISQEVTVPDIRNKKVGEAKKILSKLGFNTKVIGKVNDDSIILDQTPKPDMRLPYKSIVILNLEKADEVILVKLPELTNKTVSEATATLNKIGLNIKVIGLGTAIIQEISAGEEVALGKIIKVQFRYQDGAD
jgi:stage V sporulation protein D (sporulation-specific penicillin-binding protein)